MEISTTPFVVPAAPLSDRLYAYSAAGAFAILPPPVAHLGQVDAVVADVLAVLDELILHLLHEVGAAVAELRQAADRVDDEVKAVDVVQKRAYRRAW